MNEDEELDLIEGTDEDGNKVMLQVLEYFFYNGEEYVVLTDADESCDGNCECCQAEDKEECEQADDTSLEDIPEENMYIMKVHAFTEDGEEMEEFVPVEENMMDALIQVVKTRFKDEFADDDEEESDDKE